MHLRDLQRAAHRIAVRRGQWEGGESLRLACDAISEEVSELVEAVDRVATGGTAEAWDALVDELADVVIACASAAEELGVDLGTAVWTKLARNRRRAAEGR